MTKEKQKFIITIVSLVILLIGCIGDIIGISIRADHKARDSRYYDFERYDLFDLYDADGYEWLHVDYDSCVWECNVLYRNIETQDMFIDEYRLLRNGWCDYEWHLERTFEIG